ncbi:MAG: methyltransferase domain-containing protein [Chloroflexales bacterium]|nr:methyltransferase domain-containing protein [Chloroflexales bacterium]
MSDDREVREGSVQCRHCEAQYSITNGIVDMLGEPPDWIAKEQQGWLTLLGEPAPALAEQMLLLPYLPDPHWQEHAGNFNEIIDRIDLHDAAVLDVGSGRTWSARWLKRRGARQVVACDVLRAKYIGLETADIFMEADNIFFERVLCDMERLPFASGSYDVIFTTASLHHANDLTRAFTEIARVLRSNGRAFIINEPVRRLRSPVNMHGNLEIEVGINEHIYTIDEWLKAVKKAGLRPQLLLPDAVIRSVKQQKPTQFILENNQVNYLPWINILGRHIMGLQSVLVRVYQNHAIPLMLIAHKC